jgi:hypothetical protein
VSLQHDTDIIGTRDTDDGVEGRLEGVSIHGDPVTQRRWRTDRPQCPLLPRQPPHSRTYDPEMSPELRTFWAHDWRGTLAITLGIGTVTAVNILDGGLTLVGIE